MIIRTNARGNNTHNALRATDVATRRSTERLSSGFRINRASDDAAGLGVSEALRAQLSGLNRAVKNTRDGISMTQIAEGGMSRVNDMLIRVRELTVQMANDSLSTENRLTIFNEIEALLAEVHTVANNTEFNGIPLLGGRMPGGVYGLFPPAPGSPNIDGPPITNLNDLLRYLQGGDMNPPSGVRQPWPAWPSGPGGATYNSGVYPGRHDVSGQWVIDNIPGITNEHVPPEVAMERNRDALWNWLVLQNGLTGPGGIPTPGGTPGWPSNWRLRIGNDQYGNPFSPNGREILDNFDLLNYRDIERFMTHSNQYVLQLFEINDSPPNSYFENSIMEWFTNIPGWPSINAMILDFGNIENDIRLATRSHNQNIIIDWIRTNFEPMPGNLSGITLHTNWYDMVRATELDTVLSVENFFNSVAKPAGQYNLEDIFLIDRVSGWQDILDSMNLDDFERDFLISSTMPIQGGRQLDRFNQIMFARRLTDQPFFIQQATPPITPENPLVPGANLVYNYREILHDIVAAGGLHFHDATNFANFLNSPAFMSLFEGGITQAQAFAALGFGSPPATDPGAWNIMNSTGTAGNNRFAQDVNELTNNPSWIVTANREATIDRIMSIDPLPAGFGMPPITSPPNPNPTPTQIRNALNNFFSGPANNAIFNNTAYAPGFYPPGIPGDGDPGIMQNAPANAIRNWLENTGPLGSSTPNLYEIFQTIPINVGDLVGTPPTGFQNDWYNINQVHRHEFISWVNSQPWNNADPNHPLNGWTLHPDWHHRIPWPITPGVSGEFVPGPVNPETGSHDVNFPPQVWNPGATGLFPGGAPPFPPGINVPVPTPGNAFITSNQVQNFLINTILQENRSAHTVPGAAPPALGGDPIVSTPGQPATNWRNGVIFVFAYPPTYDKDDMFGSINWTNVVTDLYPHAPTTQSGGQGGGIPGMGGNTFRVHDGPEDAFAINQRAVINWIVEVLGGPLFRSDYLFDSRGVDRQQMYIPGMGPGGGTGGNGGQEAVARWLNTIQFDETFINRHDFIPDPHEVIIQAGANSFEQIHLTFHSMSLPAIGLSRFPGHLLAAINSEDGATLSNMINANVENIDRAIATVVGQKTSLGAKMSRMDFTISSLQSSEITAADSNSRIRDTDMAQEAMNKMKASVTQESAAMMMSQANIDSIRAAALLFASIPSPVGSND